MESLPYKIKLPPSNKEITLDKFSHKGWDFYSHTEYMMPSVEMDNLCKTNIENKLYDGRIMRPATKYVGDILQYMPINER